MVLFEEDMPLKILEKIRPHIHVKGGDYKKEDLPEYPLVKSWGGEVYILPFKKGFSTTSLIQRIQEGAS